MKSLMLIFFAALTFALPAARAQEPVPPPADARQPEKMKTWYLNLGLGIASANYSANSAMQAFVNQEKSASATELAADVDVGVYWALGEHFLLGLVDCGFGDSFSVSSSNATSSGISSGGIVATNYMASFQYFPWSPDASGIFVRADLGAGVVGTASSGNSPLGLSSSSGTAFHIAAGYAIPARNGTVAGLRIPITLGYFSEAVSSGTVTALQLGASVMF